MASYYTERFTRSLLAAVDLSAKQFYYVADNGSGKYNVAGSVVGQIGAGFLMNNPLADEACEVASNGGGAKAVASATISAAQIELKADDDGKALPALPGDLVIALSMESAAVGDIFEVNPVYYVKGAAPVTFQAAADLTGKQYYYVGDDGAGDIDVTGGATGAVGYGFLMNAPDTGEDAVINGPGHPFAKAISHDAISINDKLIALATGKVDAAVTPSGDKIIAIALSASTGADEIIDVLPVIYIHP